MISAAVTSVRVGRARGRRVAEAGPAGVRLPAVPVLGFHVMMAGDGWLITEHDAPVPLRPGDIVFTAAGAEHGIAGSPCTLGELPPVLMADVPPPPGTADFEFLCATYQVPPGRTPGFLRGLPAVLAFTPDYERHPELRTVVTMLADDCTRAQPGGEASRAALIDLLTVHILRHLPEHTGSRPPAGEPAIAGVLREIHENPGRPWTVQQLSDVAGLSRAAFTRRFRAATGTSPMAYLTQWRLDSAAHVLQQSDAPLTAVARRFGYATPFAFTTAFRRRYGVPPGRYRTTSAGGR